jgi:hypothetical protein
VTGSSERIVFIVRKYHSAQVQSNPYKVPASVAFKS